MSWRHLDFHLCWRGIYAAYSIYCIIETTQKIADALKSGLSLILPAVIQRSRTADGVVVLCACFYPKDRASQIPMLDNIVNWVGYVGLENRWAYWSNQEKIFKIFYSHIHVIFYLIALNSIKHRNQQSKMNQQMKLLFCLLSEFYNMRLDHNLSKNVSKGPAFFMTQIQTIENGTMIRYG